MTKDRVCATDTGLPDGCLERLKQFAEWTQTTPPDRIVVGLGSDQTFSDKLLVFANENGLSLDWLWRDNAQSLVVRRQGFSEC